ncbi:hypothetical protein [Rhodoblastus sp.]|uniref:hypothetical protein n=1 Tax=Rhodoblastus sp. TaxID=1962975 RepID=UPI003F9A2260
MSLRELARAYLEKAAVPQVSQRDTIGASQRDKQAVSAETLRREGVPRLAQHGTAESGKTLGTFGTYGTLGTVPAVVIDIAEHLGRAQRIADRKNADAARRRHTDRWCKCGDYAARAWRIAGVEIWLCPVCEKDGASSLESTLAITMTAGEHCFERRGLAEFLERQQDAE